MPAYNTASMNARRNNAYACRFFTSTPGDLDSSSCMEAMQIIENTCKWTEEMYNMTQDEIHEYVSQNSNNGIVYVEYNYKQLGKD